ncbi:MAG: hypothetical protein IPJ65_40655 [Archangiaceae bacterium]|nr:hypothetical protein [Archangiaceae bacterium]
MKRWLAVLLACGCGTPISALTTRKDVMTAMGPITVCTVPKQAADAETVAHALEAAAPKVARWGALSTPVELYLMPSHRDLEWAAHRHGYGWLRAWAQYDDVLLQAPSTWSTHEHDVGELLAHELTHCVMYQKSATPRDWALKAIPLWFREGMASWTAEQGHRWMSLEDLARVYEEGPGADPIADADALYQERSAAVYAASHYAFSFLMNRYGAPAVEKVMAGMAQGEPFDAAFREGVGLETARFVAEFRRYIVWRAFRGSGRSVRPQP